MEDRGDLKDAAQVTQFSLRGSKREMRDPVSPQVGDGFLVFGRLSLVNFHARHGDNTGSGKVGGGLESVLDLRSGGKDDQLQVSSLGLGNVSSLKSSLTSGHVVHIVVLVNVLTREDKGGRSFLAGGGVSHGGNSF